MHKEKPNQYSKQYSFNNFYSKIGNPENQGPRIIKIVEDAITINKYPEYLSVLKLALSDLKSPRKVAKDTFKLSSYSSSELALLDDTEVHRYIYHRYRYDIYPVKKITDDYPPYLNIEPSSICNYRCVFCFQSDTAFSNNKSGHQGTMKVELFKEIVDQIKGRIEFVSLASRGEPLVCKQIDKMLEYTTGKFLSLKMNTNASLLTEKNAHAILSSGIGTVVCSADAADPINYSKFRVNGDLNTVVRNLERFNEIKVKQYPHSKIITRVSGVKVNNEQNIDTMIAFWGNLVDQVAFVKYNPLENIYDCQVNNINSPCSELWLRMFVWYNGLCNPCENDYKSTLAIGNISSLNISRLWTSQKYQELRHKHLNSHRQEQEPCKRCFLT
jgi:radical SAM protein with 4Fe4S-binding SPASM domain